MLAHQLWKASYSCRIGLASILAVTIPTGWTEAGSWLPQPLWKASYSCRIGLASNLAATVAIANPIHCASFRFPQTGFCGYFDSPRHASAISTRLYLAASFPDSAGFMLAQQLWKASYSCRIGLASNLAAAASTGWTEAGSWLANLNRSASLQDASSVSTCASCVRLLDRIGFDAYGRFLQPQEDR